MEHYAFCKDLKCKGCLPTHDALVRMNILDLWEEMLYRCIAQTPMTKTAAGAHQAILDNEEEYIEASRRIRASLKE